MTRTMQEPTFLVLVALLERPLHGYALLARIPEVSDGRVRMRVGTLYAALDRMTAEGLVEVSAEEVVNGRARRTYRITGAGTAAVTAETQRLESLALAARARLSGAPRLGLS